MHPNPSRTRHAPSRPLRVTATVHTCTRPAVCARCNARIPQLLHDRYAAKHFSHQLYFLMFFKKTPARPETAYMPRRMSNPGLYAQKGCRIAKNSQVHPVIPRWHGQLAYNGPQLKLLHFIYDRLTSDCCF